MTYSALSRAALCRYARVFGCIGYNNLSREDLVKYLRCKAYMSMCKTCSPCGTTSRSRSRSSKKRSKKRSKRRKSKRSKKSKGKITRWQKFVRTESRKPKYQQMTNRARMKALGVAYRKKYKK